MLIHEIKPKEHATLAGIWCTSHQSPGICESRCDMPRSRDCEKQQCSRELSELENLKDLSGYQKVDQNYYPRERGADESLGEHSKSAESVNAINIKRSTRFFDCPEKAVENQCHKESQDDIGPKRSSKKENADARSNRQRGVKSGSASEKEIADKHCGKHQPQRSDGNRKSR